MATLATTHTEQAIILTPTPLLAFELGASKWKLGLTTGVAQRPRERSGTAEGDGHRYCVGLAAVPAGERAVAMVSGTVLPGEYTGAEDWYCRTSPQVADRALAVPEDGDAPQGSRAQGRGTVPMNQRDRVAPQDVSVAWGSKLLWCGQPAVPPGSSVEPTVRWGCPLKRFTVRLVANKGLGGRQEERQNG
jgi:hypothetical protein